VIQVAVKRAFFTVATKNKKDDHSTDPSLQPILGANGASCHWHWARPSRDNGDSFHHDIGYSKML
jgi:hypothetical protein